MSTNQNKFTDNSYFMRLALLQAEKNLGNTGPNPSVGCVIQKKGSVISVGQTSVNGRPHAEHNAMNIDKNLLKNSNLYVTLEPCSHYGFTPPCVKAIIKNRIGKVFFSVYDPDFRSYKKSSEFLRKKNIFVKKGVYSNQLDSFYRSYFKSKRSILPFVTCKLAISNDFFSYNKNKRWITNKFSRGRVHLMRSNHDCILTSSSTVLKDNPSLLCRINGLADRSPVKIIIDNKLKIPIGSKIVKEALNHRTIIFYNKFNKRKIILLKKAKVECYSTPLNFNNNIDLLQVLIKIKELGFSRIFLESGIKLATNFLIENLIDDLKLFVSGKKIGKNGKKSFKNAFLLFLKRKQYKMEKVNLFGDKLLSYTLK